MGNDQLHLIVNLGAGLLLWAVALFLIWWVFPMAWPLGVTASLLALVLAAYATHRLLPRLTGPIVDRRTGNTEGD